jgi:hypothetical protein
MPADATPISAGKTGKCGFASIEAAFAIGTKHQHALIGEHRRWIGGHRRFQSLALALEATL